MAAAASGIENGNNVHAQGQYVTPIPREDMALESVNIEAFARDILGRWSDRTNPSSTGGPTLYGRALTNMQDRKIFVEDIGSAYHADIGESEEEASEKISNKLNASLSLPTTIPMVSVGASIGYNTSREATSKNSHLIYMIRHFAVHRCSLVDRPNSRDETQGERKDSIVAAVQIYSGYELVFRVGLESIAATAMSRLSGDLNVNLLTGWLKAGIDGERKFEERTKRRIQSIHLDVRSFGGFRCALQHPDNYTFDKINQIAGEVSKVFSESLAAIVARSYYVSMDDVVPINFRPAILKAIRTLPTIPQARRAPLAGAIPTLPKKNRKEQFKDLANQISFDKARKGVLDVALRPYTTRDGKTDEVKLDVLLECLEESLLDVLQIKPRQSYTPSYVMVIGFTGVGKSTLVGYLTGGETKKEERPIHTGGTQTVIVFKDADPMKYPAIGHEGGSKTKGAMAFPPYIDTAGYMATKGPEEDICGQLACNAAIGRCLPNRVIVVVTPGELTELRCQRLLDLLNKLQRYIPALGMPIDGPSLMSSVYVVVNDKDDLYKEKHVSKAIDKAIGELTIEQNGIVELTKEEKDAAARWAQEFKDSAPSSETTAAVPVQQTTFLKRFKQRQPSTSAPPIETKHTPATPPGLDKLFELAKDKPKYEKWLDLEGKIAMLNSLKNEGNILVTDFEKNETRDRINAWLADPSKGRLSRDNFNIRDRDKETRMRGVLSVVASYFLERSDKNKELLKGIEGLQENIDRLSAELAIQSVTADRDITAEDIEDFRKGKDGFEKKLGQKKEEKNNLEEQKRQKITEREVLSKSIKEVLLETLTPTNGNITPRPFWRFPAFAYDYKFKCTVPVIERAKNCVPKANPGSKYPGGHFMNDVADYSKGKYEVEYKSAYFGFVEDCNACVEVYVKEKDHPNTPMRLQALDIEIKNLETRIRGLGYVIDGIETSIGNYERMIKQGTSKIKQKHLKDQLFKLQAIEKGVLEEKMKRAKIEHAIIQQELDSFKDFCGLVRDTITELNSLERANQDDPTTQTFEKFRAAAELFREQVTMI